MFSLHWKKTRPKQVLLNKSYFNKVKRNFNVGEKLGSFYPLTLEPKALHSFQKLCKSMLSKPQYQPRIQ